MRSRDPVSNPGYVVYKIYGVPNTRQWASSVPRVLFILQLSNLKVDN